MTDVLNLLALSFLGSILALAGGVVFLVYRKWSQVLANYSVPFAAGVLLTVSMIGLMPEAVDAGGEGLFAWVLGAFLGAFLFESFLFGLHHHESGEHARNRGPMALVIIGDTIHNFIDGMAIAASYFVAPGLGMVTAISTFLHEVPHEIGDFGVLLKAGWKRKSILIVNVLSASTTFLGAGAVWRWSYDHDLIAKLLAVAAGLFLYLGASDFLPHIYKGKLNMGRSVVALLLGVAAMLVTFMVFGHE